MRKYPPLKLFLATALSFSVLNSLEISLSPHSATNWLNVDSQVQAKSSGGRSGGGSFRRSSGSSPKRSSSPSRSRSSSPSRSHSSPSHRTYSTSPTYSRSQYQGTSSRTGMLIVLGLVFGISGLVIFSLVYGVLKGVTHQNSPAGKIQREINNDTVTVSKLQVALLATATEVQSALSELTLRVNTDTNEGLQTLLQESILTLLRHSEEWTHGRASSQTVKIDQAEEFFSRLSLEERAKLSAETLSNVSGYRQQRTGSNPDEQAYYIVVTLIVGTAHDKPLFKETIRQINELQSILQAIATTPLDYLMKLELIWSPQHEDDSMTYDEFVSEYTEMIQLV